MSPMMPKGPRRDRTRELADVALEDLERPARFHRARRFGNCHALERFVRSVLEAQRREVRP